MRVHSTSTDETTIVYMMLQTTILLSQNAISCTHILTSKLGGIISPPPLFLPEYTRTSIQSRSLYADWTRLLSMYGGAWLPLYAKYPQDLLTSTQKYSSAQTPATGSQCGEAMVMAARFALLVEANMVV